MGGKSSLKERVKRSFEITHASKDISTKDIEIIEAVIYTMAEKFLDEVDIKDVREMVKMTKLARGYSVTEIAEILEEAEDTITDVMKKYNLGI